MARKSAGPQENIDREGFMKKSIVVLLLIGGIAAAVDSLIALKQETNLKTFKNRSEDPVDQCIERCITRTSRRLQAYCNECPLDVYTQREACESNCKYQEFINK